MYEGAKHEGYERCFNQLSRTWHGNYTKRNHKYDGEYDDIIYVGFYHPEGGISGEFRFNFGSFISGGDYIEMVSYNDSWSSLFYFSDLIEEMAVIDDKDVTPDEFVRILIGLGIKDRTRVNKDD